MNNYKNPIIDVITNTLLGELKEPKNTVLGIPSMFDVIRMSDVQNPTEPFKTTQYNDKVVYEMDMPGVKIDDINVNTENNVLTVSADRYSKVSTIDENGSEIEKSTKSGVYEHEILLKDNSDVKAITANYENGVLVVTVPVKEEAKSRTIKVEGK